MGSSCSSRQSDSSSINSDESDSRNPEDVKTSPTKTKIPPNEKDGRAKNNRLDRELKGEEARLVSTPDSPSVTRINSNPLKSSASKSCPPKKVELPDLSSLRKEVRALVEGKISACSPFNPENKICICLLGTSQESSKCLSAVVKRLSEELLPETNSLGWEVTIVNPENLPPVYKSSHSLSHIVSHYIKDEVYQISSKSRVYIVFYVDSTTFEPPQMISKTRFQYMTKKDNEFLSKWYSFDPSLNVYRLNLPQIRFENLKQNSDKNAYATALERWHEEYQSLLSYFEKNETAPDVTSTSAITKKLMSLKDVSMPNCQVKIYIKESMKNQEQLQQSFEKCISKEDIVQLPKSATIDEAAKPIVTFLESSIKDLIHKYESLPKIVETGNRGKILEEISDHNHACKIVTCSGTKVKTDLEQIKQYMMQPSKNPFVICGDRGSGKSYICSQIAVECQQWNPLFHIAIRYVDTTPNSSTLEGIMYFLREHCAIIYGAESNLIKLSELGNDIRKLWKKSTNERPFVLILDDLDALHPSEEAIGWLFDLPETIKVILAIRSSESDSPLAKYLGKRIEEQHFMKLNRSKKGAEDIFVSNFPRESNPCKSFESIASSTPLQVLTPAYIMILSQILMIMKDRQEPFHMSFEGIVKELFVALAFVFPKDYLQGILGTMTLRKSGLTSSEFVSISKSLSLSHSFDWLSLRVLIRPLLRVRKENKISLIGWANDYIRTTAHQHFLGSPEDKLLCQQLLWKFVANSDKKQSFDASSWKSKQNSFTHKRSFQESSTLIDVNAISKYFFNYDWLKEKLRLCSPFKLLDDLNSACKNLPDSHELNVLKKALHSSVPSLLYDERQLASQIYGRLKFTLADDSSSNLSSLIEAITKSSSSRFLPNYPCFSMLEDSKNEIHLNAIFRIPGNSDHIIALSDTHGQVQVWNIVDKKVVRTLNGINQPRNLEMIDCHRCLLLCGRELRIYNVNDGTFLMKLREVMNQKMPFFGLHNSDHVVALSRSRMYVNMMNLNDGTCVTTFKVGEDRFLSSLVVSENGKICVCGDDSQKPSALLVWDLESRKLLHDLRIPFHEFNTKLVAISTEGHYVCSVSKENDDPAPNFIVVYDLQSGTLFKRWKPDVNIISITISTLGTCVIVGLEDSSIMAYDLVTGNVRWTVVGHTSPPDIFKLDEKGSVVLSYNSPSIDHSIRIWDIHTGEAIAIFTPDEPITACEIMSDGKTVIVALRGRPEIICLSLYREGENFPRKGKEIQIYGDSQFSDKIFELSDTHKGIPEK